jgi:AbrB family looped-hinge helix DNA binding protein
MIETAKMSQRGQIIIPKDIREGVHAHEDTLFAFSTLDEDTIVMRRIDDSKIVSQFKALRKNAKKVSEALVKEEISAFRRK